MSTLAKTAQGTQIARPHSTSYFTPEQIATLKNVICPGLTDSELDLVGEVAKQTGLSPFAKQLYVSKRWDSMSGTNRLTIQTAIDGYRLIAERTGKYLGQRPFEWCGADGVWRDIWLSDAPPAAARAVVLKAGCEPFVATARYAAYVQLTKEQKPTQMWRKMGAEQLAKCAEALALRKAFPQELSGVYTEEEMAQAENVREPVQARAEVLEPPPRAPQLPASTPAPANTSGVVSVKPLPTHTSKNYPVKECANKPFTELSDGELGDYIAYYSAKLEARDLQPNHREMVRATVLAAEREMERRIEEEGQPLAADAESDDVLDEPPAHETAAPDYDPETGEVLATPDDQIAEKLQQSLDILKVGMDPHDGADAWGMPAVDKPKVSRTRRSAS